MDDFSGYLQSLPRHAANPVFAALPLPAALLDPRSHCVLAANPALLACLGCSEPDLLGRPLGQWQRVHERVRYDGPARYRCANGHEVVLQQYVQPAGPEAEAPLLWTAHPRGGDVEDGLHDVRTGLASRRGFEARLQQQLATGHGTLLYIELDPLKLINDAYGREAGNRLIAEVGHLLSVLVRAEDTPAYLGGDEFAVLLERVDTDRAWQLAERIRLQVAAQGFEWRGHTYGATVSIGIVALADVERDLGAVFAAADDACGLAKRRGRNRIELYKFDQDERRRREREQARGAQLLDTLEDSRFALFRQRIVPLSGNAAAMHYEILLRVRDAAGWASPAAFVATAERYGLMASLDRKIITRCLRVMSRAPESDMPHVTINLSGGSLADATLPAFIGRCLEQTGIEPRRLCFEVTETAAIANIQHAAQLVRAVRELGCAFALDDFGAGMSSFSYLKSLDVDAIKIDGSFVRGVARDAMDAATVESIVRLAGLRGLRTVAECVEDAETLECLRAMGLDYAQGFHLHRPEPWSLP
ncbi:MAG TPA: EAL domain-containing protein [Solimonas sp.]|nr:EAL domain-containing protein [Solimonas sp.]